MTARHVLGSSGTTTELALPGLAVMAAPRDGVIKVDRSTQLHERWGQGPIVAFRAEFWGAVPRNPKNDNQKNVVPDERVNGVGKVRRTARKRAFTKAINQDS